MQETSDRALIERVRRGEDEAFGELVRRYQTSVFNVCYRFLGERQEAEDLAQEAFFRAYQRIRSYDPERPFGPWMRRVAANLCINHLRRSRLLALPLDEEYEAPAVTAPKGPEAALEEKERSGQIRTAIRELPVKYRAVIELRHFQHLTYAEIAKELGLPLSDVKSHLYRARQQLARNLKRNE